MRKTVLLFTIAVFSMTALTSLPYTHVSAQAEAFEDKKKSDKKKDPPGPPVVRDKQPKGDDRRGRDKKP